MVMKVTKCIRLTTVAAHMVYAISLINGVNQSGVIELAVRELAEKYGVTQTHAEFVFHKAQKE